MTNARRRAHELLAACLAAVLALLVAAPVALAQDGSSPPLEVREVQLDDDGGTRIVVALGQPTEEALGPDDFVVSENGEPIQGLTVTPLLDAEPEAVSIALLMDVSGSTQGEPLANAKTAAAAFVDDLTSRGARVALIQFGLEATVLVPLTRNPAPLNTAIDGLEAGGETAAYDAVALAARQLANTEGQRSVVIFTDGGDTASETTLEGAIAAATQSGVEVTAVSLTTTESDEASLQQLASATGGTLQPVAAADQLGEALGAVARQLANQYVIEYESTTTGTDLTLTVSLASDAAAAASLTVVNPRVPQVTPATEPPRPVPPPPSPVLFDSTSGLLVGLLATFAGIALLLGVTFVGVTPTEGSRLLKRRLERFDPDRDPTQSDVAVTQLSDRVADIVGSLPKPAGYEEKTQAKLDQAAWPIRASEFLTLRIGISLGGFIIGLGLFRNIVLGVTLFLLGVLGPGLVLSSRINRRGDLFHEQLPDTLQMLASSLRAGYGMLQGLDNVVREGADPTASEFGRVLTEARLGVPLEKALDDMAERMNSDDFRWVVVAISIQRRIGGNLAQLLDTVAATLRERDQVRRQIRVLSAEGRLSGVVLVVMPIGFALYLMAVRPSYLEPLIATTPGRIVSLIGVAAMIVGAFWMKKLTEIDV